MLASPVRHAYFAADLAAVFRTEDFLIAVFLTAIFFPVALAVPADLELGVFPTVFLPGAAAWAEADLATVFLSGVFLAGTFFVEFTLFSSFLGAVDFFLDADKAGVSPSSEPLGLSLISLTRTGLSPQISSSR